MVRKGKDVLRGKAMDPRFYCKSACVALAMSLAGCEVTEAPLLEPKLGKEEPGDAKAAGLSDQTDTRVPASTTSLAADSTLATLAADLDKQATARSSAVQEIEAAQASLNARRFDRYPQLRPTASAPLTGDGQASIGLNIEQLIWDGGRVAARLTDAEMNVAEATLEAWKDRNSTVYDGLEAFVEMARFEARLEELTGLRRELEAISTLLQTRRDGGVADRGETLRMASALQEVERRAVADTASLREARTDLVRLLPATRKLPSLSDLGAAARQCQRTWPDSEPPSDALLRVRFARAEASEQAVRARRFPKLVLSGGTAYSRSGWSDPMIGVQLDASEMLGLGRRGNIQAAAASTRAAEAAYTLQREDTQADLSRLEADYAGLRADISALRGLSKQSDDTISLFKEQLDAGSIPLTEGIILHRERTDTRISLVDAHADVLLNCLRASRNRGLLAPFGVLDD